MKLQARDITLVSLFVALMVISAMVARFFPTVVPFSLQPFVALLAGVILGKRLGPLAIGVYILLGLVGVPVFAKAPFGGFSYVLQPTFGFLLGFVLTPYIIGLFIEGKKKSLARYVTGTLLGVVAMYLVGLPYLYVVLKYVLELEQASWMYVIKIGFIPFITLDVVKAVVASVIGLRVAERVLPSARNHTAVT
ncbi:MAG: biotin transporter BioY [Bacillaceae bacterium]|nr:biotin transporter BioY [Bacillaceae bacterium]